VLIFLLITAQSRIPPAPEIQAESLDQGFGKGRQGHRIVESRLSSRACPSLVQGKREVWVGLESGRHIVEEAMAVTMGCTKVLQEALRMLQPRSQSFPEEIFKWTQGTAPGTTQDKYFLSLALAASLTCCMDAMHNSRKSVLAWLSGCSGVGGRGQMEMSCSLSSSCQADSQEEVGRENAPLWQASLADPQPQTS
jgi:hypothetical protein